MIKRVTSCAVSHNRRRKWHSNDGRQQPCRPDDKRSRQREINSADGYQREKRLPARFRLIDVPARLRHKFGITQASVENANRVFIWANLTVSWCQSSARFAANGKLPEGENWLYELKLDGFRSIAFKRGSKVYLRSRNNKDFNASYPGIVKALAELPDETVIDGEVVALDETGRPSFSVRTSWMSSSRLRCGALACCTRNVTPELEAESPTLLWASARGASLLLVFY